MCWYNMQTLHHTCKDTVVVGEACYNIPNNVFVRDTHMSNFVTPIF